MLAKASAHQGPAVSRFPPRPAPPSAAPGECPARPGSGTCSDSDVGRAGVEGCQLSSAAQSAQGACTTCTVWDMGLGWEEMGMGWAGRNPGLPIGSSAIRRPTVSVPASPALLDPQTLQATVVQVQATNS